MVPTIGLSSGRGRLSGYVADLVGNQATVDVEVLIDRPVSFEGSLELFHAFDVAGDPTSFPEQVSAPRNRDSISNLTEGLRPWQPKKIYYFSDADGSRCIWAQRLEPATKTPVGEPFAVLHLHSRQHSVAAVSVNVLDLSVVRDKIVFTLGELRGNVWMMESRR